MAKQKKETSHNVEFAKGGTTPMFGHGDRTTTAPQEQAGEAKEGQTGKSAGAGAGDKYACGGSTKMFGFSPSVPAKAGQTGAR